MLPVIEAALPGMLPVTLLPLTSTIFASVTAPLASFGPVTALAAIAVALCVPVTSPLRLPLKFVVLLAVEALPLRLAVIVPAEKLPEPSRLTRALLVLAAVALL